MILEIHKQHFETNLIMCCIRQIRVDFFPKNKYYSKVERKVWLYSE